MNTNLLKAFYYTAKLKSFSNAAKFLEISQPSVTRQVQDFQNELQLSLINKNKKTVELTSEGKKIFEIAKDFFRNEIKITAEINDLIEKNQSRIKIYSTETFAIHYFSYIYPDFISANPENYVSLGILPDNQVVMNLIDLNCDFGILSKKVKDSSLTVHEILEDRIVLICPKESKFTGKDFVDSEEINGLDNVFFMEKDCGTIDSVKKFLARNKITVNVKGDFSNSEILKNFVKRGMGYGFIAENVIKNEIERGEIHAVRINDPELKRKFYLAYNSQKIMKKPVRLLIENIFDWGKDFYLSK